MVEVHGRPLQIVSHVATPGTRLYSFDLQFIVANNTPGDLQTEPSPEEIARLLVTPIMCNLRTHV